MSSRQSKKGDLRKNKCRFHCSLAIVTHCQMPELKSFIEKNEARELEMRGAANRDKERKVQYINSSADSLYHFVFNA